MVHIRKQKKKNEIMPLAATWTDLEIIIRSEVSQKEKDKYHDITYMWNLKKKKDTKLIYKTDPLTQKTNLWYPKENRVHSKG